MGLIHARAFVNAANTDAALQNALNASNWDLTEAVVVAAAHGYEFSTDELQAALDELWGDMSEEQLLNAAGGTPPGGIPAGGPIIDHGDGYWSPPSGEISGKSCFFGPIGGGRGRG